MSEIHIVDAAASAREEGRLRGWAEAIAELDLHAEALRRLRRHVSAEHWQRAADHLRDLVPTAPGGER